MLISGSQSMILFWVFIGFFVIIGVVALLSIVGIIKTDKRFTKWAVSGFVAGIAGVVFVWAKHQTSLDVFVNIAPPAGVEPETFILESGKYYLGSSNGTDPILPSSVELTAGHDIGWWRAKFPHPGKEMSVELLLTDIKGKEWEVRPFYPTWHSVKLSPKVASSNNIISNKMFSFGLVNTVIAQDNPISSTRTVRFSNTAKNATRWSNKTYYDWCVFVDETQQVLNTISEVEYLLHPTFSKPLQISTERNDKFETCARGWGEFTIQIQITFTDITTQKTTYRLKLPNQ